jgi:hypothetical protein
MVIFNSYVKLPEGTLLFALSFGHESTSSLQVFNLWHWHFLNDNGKDVASSSQIAKKNAISKLRRNQNNLK